ncbi:MAG: DUF2162 domain-containing protein [Deltaproteobacteria bacterium]|nr:DUF2162 domain-containing protein [Deltaproteobacteria bacterium]
MEIKTLWLGLLLSMATFAVKTGLGWAYLWSVSPNRKRLWASLAILSIYAALFGGIALFVSKVNLLAHYDIFAPLWRNAVTLHWLVAAMLLLWGVILLGKPNSESCAHHSRGYLALVIPCPVCLSVVLMSTSSLTLYFPDQALQATACLFFAFLLIALLAGLIINRKTTNSQSTSNKLGLVMCMLAGYFMLSALLVPHFSELSQVYRLAANGRNYSPVALGQIIGCLGVIIVLAGLGFAVAKKRMGNQKSVSPSAKLIGFPKPNLTRAAL